MFIPLYDTNSLKHIRLQYVTFALIILNVIGFFLTAAGGEEAALATVYGLGFIPAAAFDIAELPVELVLVPENFTYITYAFLHGDIFHLGGNMLFLWVFGDNVEDAFGHIKYLIFYLACAAVGAYVHGLAGPDSEVPLIGASAAVAGIVAAYLMLHPKVKVWVLVLMRVPLRIPAYIPLLLWIVLQFGLFLFGGEDQVSFAAHIGGILAGAVLVLVLRRRGVPLFDRQLVTPEAVEPALPRATRTPPDRPVPRWGRQ